MRFYKDTSSSLWEFRNTSVALLIRCERNAIIVAFELDYTVNRGRREAEGVGRELCHATIAELMKIRRNKLPFSQRGLRAMSLILSSFGLFLSSRQELLFKCGCRDRAIFELQ